ncbi:MULTISPECIES: thioesterase family protein [unclassified Ruminococcus]|uniref:thioesterase family protein n=1 Tax=unclassified Ruminococcus TaxID=2608920 RepID=UPI00210C0256|nr:MULTISPECIES: hotdog domain-containing protein [unclassified Ruminococcus]MCQ4021892.1 hypothetical protein [Ruminococcus sp. zg-924]MCQ4114337.1 hypothetical protein [Ruminococcus sp. zg-921]
MNEYKIGDAYKTEAVVTEAEIACTVGSGRLRVYATPAVVALIEAAASQMAQTFVEEGITTVGTRIAIDHVSATPVSAKVWAEAVLKEIDGRRFVFEVSAYDEKGLIAKGEHERFSVKSESFQKKADSKLC